MNGDLMIYLGIPVVAVIIGLVQLAKGLGMSTKYAALLSVGFGIVAGGIGFYFTADPAYLFLGLVTGLAAAGLFSGIKKALE